MNRYGRQPWLDDTMTLFHARSLRTVVEIGSVRIKDNTDLDGYSTVCFATHAQETWTVDIDPAATVLARKETAGLNKVHAVNADGVEWLHNFDGRIDLLYLDGWDVGTDEYQRRHLEAYLAAFPKLTERALVLIDDCDLDDGGKGGLVVPRATFDGFWVVFTGKMVLLARGR